MRNVLKNRVQLLYQFNEFATDAGTIEGMIKKNKIVIFMKVSKS